MTGALTNRPALATHLAWLNDTADRLEGEAREAEALATGRATSGSLSQRHYFAALDLIASKRSRATDYRRKALKLRIEENKRRRASA